MADPGEILGGRYELIAPIGSGGMATVWRARDTRLRRQVAVKLLRPEFGEDPEFVRRFEVEARHAASLSHPNVATVHDTDLDGDQRFIVMELIDGPSVADVIAQRGPLQPLVAVEVAAAAARALAAAHRRGLIHRDVKPANLLIGRDGRVRLADFGIARALTSSRATTPGTVLGSIPYLSPEQARGEEATAAGDIFSLGVVLYEMLTGDLPWEADTPAAMATARLHVPAAPPSEAVAGLPDGLDGIVGRALELDPGKRYPSARVLADALEGWSRRHRARGRGKAEIRHATTALAATVTARAASRLRPVAAAGVPPAPAPAGGAAIVAGTARPNPFALPALPRGSTRHESSAVRPRNRPRRPAEEPARDTPAAAARDGQDRRVGLLVAALALGLIVVVAATFFAGGGSNPSQAPGAAVTSAAPPTAASAASVVVPTVLAAPSATVTPLPTMQPPTSEPTPAVTSPPATEPTPQPPKVSAPAAAVLAFYDAVEAHSWDAAVALWSPSMQERYPPQDYLIDRFRRTTRIDVTYLQTVSDSGGRARVNVSLTEYRSVEPSPQRFVGAWDLVLRDGRWVLNDPDF